MKKWRGKIGGKIGGEGEASLENAKNLWGNKERFVVTMGPIQEQGEQGTRPPQRAQAANPPRLA